MTTQSIQPKFMFSWIHLIADIAIIPLAFGASWWLRFKSGWFSVPTENLTLSDFMLLAIAVLPFWLAIAGFNGLYKRKLNEGLSAELAAVINTTGLGLAFSMVISFMIRTLPESRLTFMLAALVALIAGVLARIVFRHFGKLADPVRVVILQENTDASAVLQRFSDLPKCNYQIQVVLNRDAIDESGKIRQSIIDNYHFDILLIALQLPGELLVSLLIQSEDQGFTLAIAPEQSALHQFLFAPFLMAGIPVMRTREPSELKAQAVLKRFLDITVASVLLILTSPLLVLGVILAKISSPGPAFFKQDRLGLNGKRFKVIKLRTMVVNAAEILADLRKQSDEFDKNFKLNKDPRITPIGKFLRKTSIDELPQLLNILCGDMSVVGPRPIVPEELAKYQQWGGLLLKVKPGLTGFWQVSGRSNLRYEERIQLDMYYIQNWTLGLDIGIILSTIPAVLLRRGAQ